MQVDKGAARRAEIFELVEAGHVVYIADVGATQGGLEVSDDGLLEHRKVILVGQAK